MCDPLWLVTLCNCVVEFSINGLQYLYLYLYAVCLELLKSKLGSKCPRIIRVYSEMLENQVFPIPRDSLQVGGNQKERHYELMDKDEYRDISLHHLIRQEKKKFAKRIREFDRLFEANRKTPENVTDELVCVYLCADCHFVSICI